MALTRCTCRLTDCAYFSAVAGGKPAECDCSHPDKEFYMSNPCPLYRKNWEDKAANLDDLKKKIPGLRKRA